MARSVIEDISAPYSAAESWLYDRIIAPAVLAMGEHIASELASGVRDDARLLDVGCGGGQLVVDLLRRRPSARAVGLDLSAEQIGRAVRRAREAGLGGRVRFVRGSALELPFEDEAFDVVISVASIKHWPDRALGLSECIRVLEPGGSLLVLEADRGCRLEDATAFVRKWRIPAPFRPVALALFRTWVAGQAIDLEEARELLEDSELFDRQARRLDGTPALMLRGRKPDLAS